MFFGQKMRERRKAKKITMSEIANEIGVSESYISLLETEKREPLEGKILFGIAKILECELEDLTDNESLLQVSHQMFGDPLSGKKKPDFVRESGIPYGCQACKAKDAEIAWLREQLAKALDRIPMSQ